MKEEIYYKLHKAGQYFARKAHKGDRDQNIIRAWFYIQLFNLCYDLRTFLRN